MITKPGTISARRPRQSLAISTSNRTLGRRRRGPHIRVSCETWSTHFMPAGRAVDVDLEPFTTTPFNAERYADVASGGAHLVVMAYDHEFDLPCVPISPYAWLEQVVTYAEEPSGGIRSHHRTPRLRLHDAELQEGQHVTSNVAFVTMQNLPGFPTIPSAVESLRDPSSGEVRWEAGGEFHDYVDATALNSKLQTVENMGVTDISV